MAKAPLENRTGHDTARHPFMYAPTYIRIYVYRFIHIHPPVYVPRHIRTSMCVDVILTYVYPHVHIQKNRMLWLS